MISEINKIYLLIQEECIMWSSKHSTMLSIVVCWVVLLFLTAGVIFGPWVIESWFTRYRGWDASSTGMIQVSFLFKMVFYPCAVFAYITLFSLLRLLFNIKKDEIFTTQNVTYLRRISWCCVAVAVITCAGGVFYVPYLMVAVVAGFVGVMLRVVKNVMQRAVEIREENELTI